MHFCQPFGCRRPKQKVRMFANNWGNFFWGKILERTTRAKAHTIGTTIFPYRKQGVKPSNLDICWSSINWRIWRRQEKWREKKYDIYIYKRTRSKKTLYFNNFWIRILERNGFPKLNSFWLHCTLSPTQVAKFKAITDKCAMFIHILCMGFCSW
jgi:hypothetical protein